MTAYLFLGGPKHGRMIDIDGSLDMVVLPHMPEPPSFADLTGRFDGAATFERYLRREFRMVLPETRREYSHAVYIHENVTAHPVDVLSAYLLSQWVQLGSEVVEGECSDEVVRG